jgi:carbon-monoxide dehydrogenase medium subunit
VSALVAPAEFAYLRPTTLAEALDALGSREGALALAGGTDLVTMRASGQLAPETLVDIKGVPELAGVRRDDGVVRAGAATPFADLLASGVAGGNAVADGAALVGAVQTRHRATIGGNVCRSSPAGDTLPGLLVLAAEAELASADESRRIGLEEFFLGPGQNALQPGELLTSLEFDSSRGASAYRRLTYRAWMDLAVIGVAVWLELDGDDCHAARVALGGLAPVPLLVPDSSAALAGTELSPGDLDAAVEAAVAAARPISDVRGTSEHRIAGLRALLPRVVADARERAGEAG